MARPCDRLVLAWSADAAQLQKIVGVNLTHRVNDGVGPLQLSIMQCDPLGRSGPDGIPLLFAYVMVPVTADGVPLVITSIPTDGCLSLLQVVADPNSNALFSQLGYEVAAADISFALDHSERESTIAERLDFDKEHISVVARTAGESVPHEASKALLVSGTDYLSAFFGQESAQRYSSVSPRFRSRVKHRCRRSICLRNRRRWCLMRRSGWIEFSGE